LKSNRAFLVLGACAIVVLASCASPPTAAPVLLKDYLGENIKIVGFRVFSWIGDLYTVPFYTAEVLTPPSPATKNEGLVKPTGKVADLTEPQFWTPYIASSRPATKDELKPGVLVFAVGDAQPVSRDNLAKSTKWSLLRVKDISNLFKGTVTLEYHDTYWETWKAVEYHVDNIRVILGEFSTELAK
jgi:hypothetical protein